ncbi:MAG: DUF3892 domain-containing protein [Bacteroidota bacterium]
MEVAEIVIGKNNSVEAICNLEAEWTYTKEKAIHHIEQGDINFYVQDGSEHKTVIVCQDEGEKYLSTAQTAYNKLKELPVCSIDHAIRYLTG